VLKLKKNNSGAKGINCSVVICLVTSSLTTSNDGINSSGILCLNGIMISGIMNWEGCGRMQPNMRYCFDIYLEELKKIKKNLIQDIRYPSRNLIPIHSNRKQKLYPLDQGWPNK